MDTLLISEIEQSTIVDDSYYKVFPTTLHKRDNSPWFFTGRDLKAEIEWSKKFINYMMWGK